MDAPDLIRLAITRGFVSDVLAIMRGESQYTTQDAELAGELGAVGSRESIAWRMAMEHLDFVSRFGTLVDRAEENGRYYAAYPNDFEDWLELGAPGFPTSDLETFLLAHSESSKE